jgi:ribonuclease PH
VVQGQILADLCYTEDSTAQVDMNLVMTSKGEFVEVQGTGEESTFTEDQLASMLRCGRAAMAELFLLQQAAVGRGPNA